MGSEARALNRTVRMVLTQLGVDTMGLEITVSGSSVLIKGPLKKFKSTGFERAKTKQKIQESIAQRLRNVKEIKRVMFS